MKILVALFLGCAVYVQAQSSNPRAACGPENVGFNVKRDKNATPSAQPEPGKALVYFVQDAGPSGGIAYPTTRLGIDGAWVGANKDSSYFAASADPGEHHVCAMIQSSLVDNSVELAHFTAEAGKVYYFRTRLLLSRSMEFLELTPMDSDEGWNLVTSYPRGSSQPKKWGR
jgi:hypothetical protein